MRKKLICIALFILLLCSGCGANLTGVNETAKSDDNIADEYIEKIVEAIRSKDNEALIEMFSVTALNKIDMTEFEKSINELFTTWQGEVVEYDGELSTATNRHSGKTMHSINGFYDIETTDTTHHLLFLSVVRDDENSDNVGLSMIVFVTDELYQSDDFYWKYGNREPGIYIDKMDE